MLAATLVLGVHVFTATSDVRALAHAGGSLVEATTGGAVVGGRLVRPGAAQALLVEGDSVLVATDAGVVDLASGRVVAAARGAGALARFRGALVAGAPAGFPRRERVTALAEMDGLLYVGTLGQGLYRWNGRKAQRVAGIDALVWDIQVDATGAWVATADGLARVDRRGRRARDAAATASRSLAVTDVRVVRVADGRPVIGTYGGGAWRWSGTEWRPVGPSDLRVQAMAVRAGALILGTPDGVVRVDADGRVALPRAGELPANDLSAVVGLPDGGAWVGTFDRGLFRVDAAGRVVERHTEKDGLLDDRVNALALDGAGELVIATERGLCFLGRHGFRVAEPLGEHVVAVAVAGGRVFAGTAKGLFMVEGARLVPIGGFPLRRVMAIGCDAVDGLPRHVGTGEGLAVRANGAWRVIRAAGGGLPDDWITAVAPLPGGSALVGTYNAGLAWIAPDGRALPFPAPAALWVNPGALVADNGRTAVGTLEGGLWIDGARAIGLPDDDVTALARAPGGALWVATRGGLARID